MRTPLAVTAMKAEGWRQLELQKSFAFLKETKVDQMQMDPDQTTVLGNKAQSSEKSSQVSNTDRRYIFMCKW